MTHFSLFSGIGGLELAAEWAGFETVGQCEFADYPYKVLCKHWPDVPKWRDIRDVTKESFYQRTGKRTVDIISGGFPCQPFSVAGKQKGKEDDRYLWPEMLRVIRELKPRWVIGENVPGILRIAGDTVCQDLEREGYDVGIFDYEAAAVGAPHRRERIFFVGNAKHDGQLAAPELRSDEATSDREQEKSHASGESARASEPLDVPSVYRGEDGGKRLVADTENLMCKESIFPNEARATGFADRSYVPNTDNGGRPMWGNGKFSAASKAERARCDHGGRASEYVTGRWWRVEPDVGRVATGISNRVDRLKCLGNAVVPQQAYPLFAAIAAVIREEGEG